MSAWTRLRGEGPALAYGFAFNLGSSVGQTFFLALFIPALGAAAQIGEGRLATLYSLATVGSALALPVLGRMIDGVDLARYGLVAAFGAMSGCVLLAMPFNSLAVLGAMFLLRLFGQGLMSHVGLTGTARYFTRDRGQALSLVALGYSAGEGILPLLTVGAIKTLGWRGAYLSTGAVLCLVIAPLATGLVRRNAAYRRPVADARRPAGLFGGGVLRSAAFWAYLPALLLPPLVLTGLMFHQGLIAGAKGLSLTVFAAAFLGYALIQVPTSLIIGRLIDRLGAPALLVAHLIPFALATAVLAAGARAGTIWAYLVLCGVTAAANSILRTAIVAKLVAPDRLGAARGTLAAFIALGTAVGPALVAALLQAGLGLPKLLDGASALALAAAAMALLGALGANRADKLDNSLAPR